MLFDPPGKLFFGDEPVKDHNIWPEPLNPGIEGGII
jgi:hypothetical protein